MFFKYYSYNKFIVKLLVLIVCLLIIFNITIILNNPIIISSTSQSSFNNSTNSTSNKLLILLADEGLFNGKILKNSFQKCPWNEFKCEITSNKSLSNESDGILFFIPRVIKDKSNTRYSNLTRTSSKQLFFGWSMESPKMYSQQNNQSFLNQHFNITIGYTRNKLLMNEKLTSNYYSDDNDDLENKHFDYEEADEEIEQKEDVNESHIYTPYGPFPFIGSNHYSHLFKFGKLKKIPKKRKNNIMWMAGNCLNEKIGRTKLVKSMMNLTDIHSYGSCLNNRELKYDPGLNVLKRSIQKFKVLKRYNFVIAIENSRCLDYVTEKLWEPLSIGTIPIYLGAPNINQYLPDKDAIINIANFKSISSLINYIDRVNNDESLRYKHLKWLTKPLPNYFKLLLKQSKENQVDLFCKICDKLKNVNTPSPTSSITYKPNEIPFKRCLRNKFTLPMYDEEQEIKQ